MDLLYLPTAMYVQNVSAKSWKKGDSAWLVENYQCTTSAETLYCLVYPLSTRKKWAQSPRIVRKCTFGQLNIHPRIRTTAVDYAFMRCNGERQGQYYMFVRAKR